MGLFARRSSASALTFYFYTAGETPRAPRAPSLVVICDLVLLQCLLGRRPCGRLLPSTTWRSQSLPTTSRRSHERRCSYELICPIAACGTFYTAGGTPRAPRAPSSLQIVALSLAWFLRMNFWILPVAVRGMAAKMKRAGTL